jgi:hypothetical protein
MFGLLCFLFSLNLISPPAATAGTELHVRLTTAVGSYASRPGMPVKAVLIEPVRVANGTVLPPGSVLSGVIKAVTRVGYGLLHEMARLQLQFTAITLPSGTVMPISTRVSAVDNGREHVNRNGRIEGSRPTAGLCYRVSGYIRTAISWEVHAQLATWVIKSLLVQMPEPEIYYPPGSELTLVLTANLPWIPPAYSVWPSGQLTCQEWADMRRLVRTMPYRTHAPNTQKPSDLTNLLLLGSREEITNAFDAAGWKLAHADTLRSRIKWIRAVAEDTGDQAGPMSRLLLNGADADMSWEKGLNDVSKRHHVRLWEQPGTWQGKQIWLAAGTRDVDFAYLRPGRTLTHRIDENIDDERDKIAYDLAYTSCASILDWVDRPAVEARTYNATGDLMRTDTQMVVMKVSTCNAPRLSTESSEVTIIASRGGRWQRFLRREILSMRNDLLRDNMYWRFYEGGRTTFDYIRLRRQHSRDLQKAESLSAGASSSAPGENAPRDKANLPPTSLKAEVKMTAGVAEQ